MMNRRDWLMNVEDYIEAEIDELDDQQQALLFTPSHNRRAFVERLMDDVFTNYTEHDNYYEMLAATLVRNALVEGAA